MATTTPKLGLPRPEGHDNVTRANHVELIDAIDENAASQSELNSVKNIAEKHADRHAAGGPDAITPSMIGAAPASHTHSASDITSGTLPISRGGTGATSASAAKSNIGLGNVDNVKQMPISGGTFTGIAVAHSNTSYGTRQIRNIILGTGNPPSSGASNGDIYIRYS